MSPERFDSLLQLVEPAITKESTNFREPISPGERLSLTLYFLATGCSRQTLSFNYRISKASVSIILRETCDSLYIALSHIYLAPPDQQGWESISKDFEETWNLPNVLGALDGKHIRIMAPPNSGTQFYNYKSHFSLQFLAMCNARYCFTLADIGSYGSNNDTSFWKRFASGTMNIPLPRSVEGCRFDPLPYYIVRDDIFPLKEWLMKPFPGTSLTSRNEFSTIESLDAGELLKMHLEFWLQDFAFFIHQFARPSKMPKVM